MQMDYVQLKEIVCQSTFQNKPAKKWFLHLTRVVLHVQVWQLSGGRYDHDNEQGLLTKPPRCTVELNQSHESKASTQRSAV